MTQAQPQTIESFLSTLPPETRLVLAQRMAPPPPPPETVPLALEVPASAPKPRPKRLYPAAVTLALVNLLKQLPVYASTEAAIDRLVLALERGGDEASAAKLREERSAQRGIRTIRRERTQDESLQWVEAGTPPRDPLVLNPRTARRLQTITRELRRVEEFVEHGIDPPTRILFKGPPGVGKTLAAAWVAFELGLPLAIARIDGVVRSHLGETGAELRKIFDRVGREPSVLFLDEIDGLMQKRGTGDSSSASSEMQRVTSSFLQQLDALAPTQIVIAATNIVDAIDDAVLSRIGEHVHFDEPSVHDRMKMVCGWLAKVSVTDEEIAALVHASELAGESGRELRARAMRLGRAAFGRGPKEEQAFEEGRTR